MHSLTPPHLSVDTSTDLRAPDAHRFPTPDLVKSAAALLTRDDSQPRGGWREGPQWRIEVSPGTVAVRRKDYARAERTANRNAESGPRVGLGPVKGPFCPVGSCLHESCGALRLAEGWRSMPESNMEKRRITGWSRRSRARMVERLGTLDYGPLLAGGGPLVMLTLTYPGDWLTVAPDGEAAFKHFHAFRKRYARKWEQPLVGVWKREFQRRGAPHLHILCAVPAGVRLADFRLWCASAWADVVDHPDPVQRMNHEAAGVGVDVAKGAKMRDPRRIGVYFSKHGTYSAKDYQNDAPIEWVAGMQPRCFDLSCGHDSCQTPTIGRFWGVLGLKPATTTVEVAAREALHAARVLARWSRAQRNIKRMPGERYPRLNDPDRMIGRSRHRLLRQRAGYLVVNDAPALVAQLSRQLDQWSGRSSSVIRNGSGAGPVGFLP